MTGQGPDLPGHKTQRSRALDTYPECPDCETDLPVAGHPGHDADYECQRCGRRFDG